MAAVAALAHGPGLWGQYAFDDFSVLFKHPAVTGEVSIWQVFSREYWGAAVGADGWSSSYRPLTSLTLALEHRLTSAPWLHHLGNLGCYAALCGVVTYSLRRFCSPRLGFVFGLFFALLPIHVENVASIPGRADVLAVLFALAAFEAAHSAAGDPPTWKRTVLSCAFFLAGMLCKESIALLPGLIGWFAILELRRTGNARQLVAAIALGAVGLVYIGLRQRFLSVGLPDDFVSANNLLVERHGAMRAFGNLSILGHYAELTFAPLRLCADHTFAVVVPPQGLVEKNAIWAWVGLPIALGMLWDGWRAWRRKSRGLFFATMLAYLLVGQWIIDLSVILAERLALWPSVWLTFALAQFVGTRSAKLGRRAVVLAAVLLVLFGVRTVDRTLDWRDQITVHRSSLEWCPASLTSRQIVAIHHTNAGDVERATWEWALVAAIRNRHFDAFESMLEAEARTPLPERLIRLSDIWGDDKPDNFWPTFHDFLMRQGAVNEAALAEALARRE